MEEHKTNGPMHMEPLRELPSPLEDRDTEEDALVPAQLLSILMEVEVIPLTMDPMDPPEATVDPVEVLEEAPEEVLADLAEVLGEDPEEVTEDLVEDPEGVTEDPRTEEAMEDTPMAELEARTEVVVADLETPEIMEVTAEGTMTLTATTSDSMMPASLGELKSLPTRSLRP